jgi:hypothetical protein
MPYSESNERRKIARMLERDGGIGFLTPLHLLQENPKRRIKRPDEPAVVLSRKQVHKIEQLLNVHGHFQAEECLWDDNWGQRLIEHLKQTNKAR